MFSTHLPPPIVNKALLVHTGNMRERRSGPTNSEYGKWSTVPLPRWFTVMSLTGGCRNAASVAYKRLASMLAEKRDQRPYRALASTSWNRHFYFRMEKGACGTTRGMAQQPWSSYYYKLDAKLKARCQEKVTLIKQEDPYALKKADFCRDTAHLPSLG